MSTKKPTRTQTVTQQFAATTKTGDLRRQVQLARPIATDVVWTRGLDAGDEVLASVVRLAGSHDVFRSRGTAVEAADAWAIYCRHINAAFALGIATGQIVSPDMFKTGGTR